MTQRVKPVDEAKPAEHKKYLKELTLLHEMLIYAMKTKQTTDQANVEKLRSLLQAFRKHPISVHQSANRVSLIRLPALELQSPSSFPCSTLNLRLHKGYLSHTCDDAHGPF